MAQCSKCNAQTELYDGDVPICVRCSEERENKRKLTAEEREITAVLVQHIVEATTEVNAAYDAFNAVVREIPRAPASDGVERIHKASEHLSIARKQMMTAHKRLNEFVGHGVIPEDLKSTLKRSG